MNFLRLRAIEAVGFKSFANKIELNFSDGITAIVGPNGSGKSNVSDAIRWVLGEQSIRTLRGSSMEDVIFSGSGKRKALNIAEVTLFFTNTEGVLPVDFQEVSICRRLFRSGDSAYFINKTSCRLKDIHDLFADTGLGKGSLSIIGQNKVDEILNCRPEDRRALFEEAAGITRYKIRKKEAMRRLEETDNNLIRLNDIKSEITDRLEPMQESAEKTRQHNLLQEMLKKCSITLSVQKIDAARKILLTAKEQTRQLEQEEIDLVTKANVHENNVFFLNQQIEQTTADLNKVQQEISSIEALTEKLSGQKDVLSERILQTNDRLASLKQDLSLVQDKLLQINDKIQNFAKRLQEQDEKEKSAFLETKDLSEKISDIQSQIKDIETNQQIEQSEILERKRNILQISNDIKQIQATIFSNQRKQEKILKEKAALEEQQILFLGQVKDIQDKISSLTDEKKIFIDKIESIRLQSIDKKNTLNQMQEQEKKLHEQAVALNTRIHILQKLEDNYEGFSYSVKKLLTVNTTWREKLLGTVSQLITLKSEFVQAIEIALGNFMQHIVCVDENTAKDAIAFLKEQKAGRATFLPLNTLRVNNLSKQELDFANIKGVVGFADKLVQCDDKVRLAIAFLLGRTLIVDNLDTALVINKKGNTRLRIVTLQGDVLHSTGMMSGGSRTNKESSFLSRKQEISTNTQEHQVLKEKLTNLAEKKHCIKEEITALDYEINHLNNELTNFDLELTKNNLNRNQTEKELDQLKIGFNTLDFEYNQLQEENVQLQNQIEQLSQQKETAQQDDINKNEQADKDKLLLEKLKEQDKSVSEVYNEAKTRYELAQNTTMLLKEQDNAMQEECLQINKEVQKFKNDENTFEQTIDECLKQKQIVEQKILEQGKELDVKSKQRDDLVQKQLELFPEQKQLEKQGKELKTNLGSVQNRLRNAQNIFVRHETELELSVQQLKDTYQLDVEQAREFCYDQQTESYLNSQISSLQEKLQQIGPVNPSAIEEYQEIKERYDFLTSQYSDLIEAKEDLNKLIYDIDRTMISRFREAFNKINAHFETCFTKLFGGGSASLKLIDLTDILSSGIEIIVQPPGKKLQVLTLLSGGERALTVIALLFALLSYRPAPFCVLDELDAALDEINVERFTNFIVDYAKDTQFLVITHRKATMQAANLLHGITMEESGVSKLVSIKMLERNEADR